MRLTNILTPEIVERFKHTKEYREYYKLYSAQTPEYWELIQLYGYELPELTKLQEATKNLRKVINNAKKSKDVNKENRRGCSSTVSKCSTTTDSDRKTNKRTDKSVSKKGSHR